MKSKNDINTITRQLGLKFSIMEFETEDKTIRFQAVSSCFHGFINLKMQKEFPQITANLVRLKVL